MEVWCCAIGDAPVSREGEGTAVSLDTKRQEYIKNGILLPVLY
jgi:hypothetical protein